MSEIRKIPFSPPDITQEEIDEVVDKMDHELCEFYQIVTRRMKSKELGRLNDSMFYEVADCTHPDYNRTLGELPCKGDKAQCVLTRS